MSAAVQIDIKKIILIIAAIFLSSSSLIAQSQMEMNRSSYNDFLKVEKFRTKIISEIKTLYSDNTEFLLAFSKAEKSWEKYRDDYLNMMFPGEDKQGALWQCVPDGL